MMNSDQAKEKFLEFTYSMMNAAFMQMGKTPNPITGKVEKDIVGARSTIDLLEMFSAKTEGNLDDQEKKFLDDALDMLRLNLSKVESGQGEPDDE